MDARSLSNTTTTTSSACFSAALSPHRRSHHHSHATSTVILFSLKPPPPPHHSPSPRSNSDDSSGSTPSLSGRIRRPKTLKTTSSPKRSTAKVPSNPLKNLVGSAYVPVLPPPPPPPPVSHSLSNRLWLSSKLSPPPPSISETSTEDENEVEESENENYSSKLPEEREFRQEGKIFVGNLPNWIKKHEVQEFFRQFGPVKHVILIKGHDATERNAGYGFVIYDGLTAAKSVMKAVEFDGVEFHGRVLTVKLDDGRRLKEKTEERARWMEGDDGVEYRSQWHEERDRARKGFRKVIETEPENWQAVVWAFERIKKVVS